jgi:hypothetical protein
MIEQFAKSNKNQLTQRRNARKERHRRCLSLRALRLCVSLFLYDHSMAQSFDLIVIGVGAMGASAC